MSVQCCNPTAQKFILRRSKACWTAAWLIPAFVREKKSSRPPAPHAEDGAAVYSGTCRGRFKSIQDATEIAGHAPAVRFAVPDRIVTWNDSFAGPQQYNIASQLGDFVIAKADGTAAYQLAVVLDDLAAGITHVVRGDDLLGSTPRQILLYEALQQAARIPEYFHLPLVIGPDGYRLAKRHGDSRLSFYRSRGVSAGRILNLLGRWCGIDSNHDIISSAEMIDRFDLQRVPRGKIIFQQEDERRLLASSF